MTHHIIWPPLIKTGRICGIPFETQPQFHVQWFLLWHCYLHGRSHGLKIGGNILPLAPDTFILRNGARQYSLFPMLLTSKGSNSQSRSVKIVSFFPGCWCAIWRKKIYTKNVLKFVSFTKFEVRDGSVNKTDLSICAHTMHENKSTILITVRPVIHVLS